MYNADNFMKKVKNNKTVGLSWWLSGKKSACQCRRHGFDPWSRKVQHAVKQLSLHISTIEPLHWSPRAASAEPTHRNCRSPNTLEHVHFSKEPSLASAREKSWQHGRPSTDKNKQIKIIKQNY